MVLGKKKKKQVTKSRASLLRPFSDVQLDIGATFVYFREKKKSSNIKLRWFRRRFPVSATHTLCWGIGQDGV